ncbi:ras-related protein Rab-17 [Podargus strigoides]
MEARRDSGSRPGLSPLTPRTGVPGGEQGFGKVKALSAGGFSTEQAQPRPTISRVPFPDEGLSPFHREAAPHPSHKGASTGEALRKADCIEKSACKSNSIYAASLCSWDFRIPWKERGDIEMGEQGVSGREHNFLGTAMLNPPLGKFISLQGTAQKAMPGTSLEGNRPTYIYKVVLLGSTSVGKSSLAYQYVKNDFKESLPTVGCSFFTQVLSLESATVKFEIWDTAGQEKYHSVCHLYYRGAHAALLVYDIANKETLNRAKLWLMDLEKEFLPDEIVIALVGNKTDLAAEREVTTEEGEEFARTKGLLFMETSAKLNHQVNDTFMAIAQELLQREQEKASASSPHGWSTVDLGESGARTRCCRL